MPAPVHAFYSYSHAADEDADGLISTLRELLERQVWLHLGDRNFTLFQDKISIQWGEDWERRLSTELDLALFYVPVITPGFFNSEWCRKEAGAVLGRKASGAARVWVLPLYVVEDLRFERADLRGLDPLRLALHAAQYRDLRAHRRSRWASADAQLAVEELGQWIAHRVIEIRHESELRAARPPPPPSPAPPTPAAAAPPSRPLPRLPEPRPQPRPAAKPTPKASEPDLPAPKPRDPGVPLLWAGVAVFGLVALLGVWRWAATTAEQPCGNGREDAGEQCDFGPDNTPDGAHGGCTTACTLPWTAIPAGTYTLGTDEAEREAFSDYSGDEPGPHEVTSAAFEVMTTEVTVAHHRRWGRRVDGDDRPWVKVSWDDARAYCAALGARLPTEAEWEVAARGHTRTPWSCGAEASCLNSVAWFTDNAGGAAHAVGTKAPNPFGLFDVHGNVWEWVADCYSSDATHPGRVTNAQQVVTLRTCPNRVVRGGGFWNRPVSLRSGDRVRYQPEGEDDDLGFRCVRGPAPQELSF